MMTLLLSFSLEGWASRVERITSIRNTDITSLNTETGELTIVGDGDTAYSFTNTDNNGATLGVAFTDVSGTVRGTVNSATLFNATATTETANALTTTADRTYSVQLDSNSQAVVNIPWVASRTAGTFEGQLNFTSTGGGSQETDTNNGNTFVLNITHADGWTYVITNAYVSSNTDIFLTNIPAGGQTVRVLNSTGTVSDTVLHVRATVVDPDGNAAPPFEASAPIHVRPFHDFGGSYTYDPSQTQEAAVGGNTFTIGIDHTNGWTYQIISATSSNSNFSANISVDGANGNVCYYISNSSS